MRKRVSRWRKLLLIPLLCAALLLFQGCGKKNTGNARQDAEDPQQITLINEDEQSESEEREDGDQGRQESEYDDGDADYGNAGEDDVGYSEEEDNDLSYLEEDDNNEEVFSDDGEYTDGSGYDEGDEIIEDGEYSDGDGDTDGDEENGYEGDNGKDRSNENEYEDEYEGSGGEIKENGIYTTREDVALYLHTYGKLPGNFITKKEAKSKGWQSGSLEEYAPGMCIGGDRFGNYERTLPKGNYHECDINTLGKKGRNARGAERLVYSDDGRIYYTDDHYETFTLLYGKD